MWIRYVWHDVDTPWKRLSAYGGRDVEQAVEQAKLIVCDTDDCVDLWNS